MADLFKHSYYDGKQLFLFFLFVLLSCCYEKNDWSNPVGYNLSNPEKMPLNASLLEISGIAFHSGRPDTIFEVNDEEGKIF